MAEHERIKAFLNEVAEVLRDREAGYGAATETHERIAQLWSAYLGIGVTAIQVAHMMALLKIGRVRSSGKRDNERDGAGYLAIAAILAENEHELAADGRKCWADAWLKKRGNE